MLDRSRDNVRRARLLVGAIALVPFVLLTLIGLLLGSVLAGSLLGVAAGAAAAVVFVRTATGRVLSSIGARPLQAGEHPRLTNLLDGLCLTSGVPGPEVRIIDTEVPDALAVGTSPRSAVVVVTSGLVDLLGRIELEGVVAHELARIRHHDIAPATLAAALGPLGDQVAGRLLAPERILAADVEACQLTRYPPGLIAALESIERIHDATSIARPAPAHLCLAPVGDDPTSHPPLHERIALLREL